MEVTSKHFRLKWIREGKWEDAGPEDAILFLATECNELAKECTEFAVQGRNYTRNNDTEKGKPKQIIEEIGGVLLMCERVAEIFGLTLDDVYLHYLTTMNEKRRPDGAGN